MARIGRWIGENDQLWPTIEVGHVLHVRGKSGHGKNRITEHGERWFVQVIAGKNLLVLSSTDGYKRWINGPNDADFIVAAVDTGNFILGARHGNNNS